MDLQVYLHISDCNEFKCNFKSIPSSAKSIILPCLAKAKNWYIYAARQKMLFKLQSIFYGFLKKLDMNSRNRGPDITTVVNVRTNLKFLNEHDRLRREYFFSGSKHWSNFSFNRFSCWSDLVASFHFMSVGDMRPSKYSVILSRSLESAMLMAGRKVCSVYYS